MNIILRNSFHGTTVSLRAEYGQELSHSQIRRARNTLCGVNGCTCGGNLGERGSNPEVEVLGYDASGKLRIRIMRP